MTATRRQTKWVFQGRCKCFLCAHFVGMVLFLAYFCAGRSLGFSGGMKGKSYPFIGSSSFLSVLRSMSNKNSMARFPWHLQWGLPDMVRCFFYGSETLPCLKSLSAQATEGRFLQKWLIYHHWYFDSKMNQKAVSIGRVHSLLLQWLTGRCKELSGTKQRNILERLKERVWPDDLRLAVGSCWICLCTSSVFYIVYLRTTPWRCGRVSIVASTIWSAKENELQDFSWLVGATSPFFHYL